ncbi:MAG: DUF3754 domain-containing protein, partial [Candidatus Hinthialibacter sp.]
MRRSKVEKASAMLPQRIIAVAFDNLCQAAIERAEETYSPLSKKEREERMRLFHDVLFHLESLVFLDGEHRADSMMSRLLRWSGPGFTRRFYLNQVDLNEDVFLQDKQYVTSQIEELLGVSHFEKLSTKQIERGMCRMSYERIFVRLQNIDFLNFFVRGSYTARQRDTLQRAMFKRVKFNEKLASSLLAPESIEVFEEVVVVVSEEIPQQEEQGEDQLESETAPNLTFNSEQMNRELEPYLAEEQTTGRPVKKRRRAIQRVVKEKMRSLQEKTLEEIMAEHTPDPNKVKHLHLIVYHNIPATDLELLLPNAEISLGVKEYVQLCFAGTATLPALGKVLLTRGMRKILMFFNPVIFGAYRILYKMNVVRTEQKFLHARYLLNHRLARGGKAVSHLADDYENVLKREAVLIFLALTFEPNSHGLTRKEIEEKAQKFVREAWGIDFEPDFERSLGILIRWG